MKRVFLAFKIFPVNGLLDARQSFITNLGNEKIKWVEKNNFHVTLFFLGEENDKRIDELIKIIDQEHRGFSSFRIHVKGAGVFPGFKRPRVIWLGIEAGQELYDMHRILGKKLKKMKFVEGISTFTPHLTLGRINRIEDIRNLEKQVHSLDGVILSTQAIHEINLFESRLSTSGPCYLSLKEWQLA